MRVALVRPMPSEQSVGLHSFMVCEPLELEYLHAALEEAGHQPVVVDMMCERRGLAELLAELRPELVGFTSYITHVNVIKRYASEVKRALGDVPTIVGGIHAEVNPQDFVADSIDFIACQNGLSTLVAAAAELSAGLPREQVVTNVPGLWNGERMRDTAVLPPRLPLPDRNSTARYRSNYNYMFHENVSLLKTSYGCPYPCDFCYCRAITGGHYAERPISDVIAELRTVSSRNVFIVDDDFLLNRNRVAEFCTALEREHIDKRYILFGRTDFIAANEDLIERFAELGLHAVFIGAESYRQADLENYHKKNSVATTEQASAILHRHGVEPYVGIVVGPDWAPSDFRGLSGWMRRNGLQLANIQPLTPMPGTKCFEQYADELVVDRTEHEQFDMTHLVIRPRKVTPRRFYWELIRTYYETSASPRTVWYIFRRYGAKVGLRMVRGGLLITWQYLRLMGQSR